MYSNFNRKFKKKVIFVLSDFTVFIYSSYRIKLKKIFFNRYLNLVVYIIRWQAIRSRFSLYKSIETCCEFIFGVEILDGNPYVY